MSKCYGTLFPFASTLLQHSDGCAPFVRPTIILCTARGSDTSCGGRASGTVPSRLALVVSCDNISLVHRARSRPGLIACRAGGCRVGRGLPFVVACLKGTFNLSIIQVDGAGCGGGVAVGVRSIGAGLDVVSASFHSHQQIMRPSYAKEMAMFRARRKRWVRTLAALPL